MTEHDIMITAMPSIVMLLLVAILSFVAGAVVRKRWQSRLIYGLAAMEVTIAVGLIILVWPSA